MKRQMVYLPENCGKRLLPVLIDETAKASPDAPYISIFEGLEFEDINFGLLGKAINRCAWWLEEKLGRSFPEFQTISTFLDPHDLRHLILIMATIKTGYKVTYLLRLLYRAD